MRKVKKVLDTEDRPTDKEEFMNDSQVEYFQKKVLDWEAALFFFFKQKTAYELAACLVGSEMCIRDSSLVSSSNIHSWPFANWL